MSANDDLRLAAERLACLIGDRQVILFVENSEHREHPYIKLSVWGAIPTNELFIKLTNGVREIVTCAPSLLEYPPMADRLFGMDILDQELAAQLAEKTWELHKHELIIPPQK